MIAHSALRYGDDARCGMVIAEQREAQHGAKWNHNKTCQMWLED